MQNSPGAREGDSAHSDATLWIRVGKLRPVPVRYLEDSGRFYLIPTGDGSGWATLALHEGRCSIALPGEPARDCATSYVSDPSRRETLRAKFRASVGEELWTRYFSDQPRMVELDPTAIGSPPSTTGLIEAEFDTSAPSYDAAVARHSVDRYLKTRVSQLLSASLRGVDPLLEIGPGTGFHTLPLLAEGHRILAVDLSSRMLSLLTDRATTVGGVGRLEVRKGRLGEIPSLLSDLPDATYGAVYSAFGAFNLERDTQEVGSTLARVLRPGGRLLFTTLNRPGVVPLVWDFVLGRPKAAAGRLQERVPAGGLRYPLELFLRTPENWDRILGPQFHRVATQAVSALAPPFDSPRIDVFLGDRGARRMAALDGTISEWGPAWRLAEWIWLEFERVHPSAGPFKL